MCDISSASTIDQWVLLTKTGLMKLDTALTVNLNFIKVCFDQF